MKGFWNVKVICAVISGVALIVAACIGVADRYLLEGVDDGQVPVPLLEEQLSDVNIYLSKIWGRILIINYWLLIL